MNKQNFLFKAKGLGLGFLIFSNLTHHKIHNWNFCAETKINVCVDHKQQAFKHCFLIVNSRKSNSTCLPSTTQGHFQHFWAELRIFWSPPFKQENNARLSRSHLKQLRFSCSIMGNPTGVYGYGMVPCQCEHIISALQENVQFLMLFSIHDHHITTVILWLTMINTFLLDSKATLNRVWQKKNKTKNIYYNKLSATGKHDLYNLVEVSFITLGCKVQLNGSHFGNPTVSGIAGNFFSEISVPFAAVSNFWKVLVEWKAVSVKHRLRTADFGPQTGYKTRSRYKMRATDYDTIWKRGGILM